MDHLLNSRFYYPMLVSFTGTANPPSHEEDVLVWKKFLTLSKLKQDTITDEQMPIKIAELQEKFHLSDQGIGLVSLHIRKIFFEELSLADGEASLKAALSSSGDDAGKAGAIMQFIQNEILTIKPQPKVEEAEGEEEKSQTASVKMPLLQALSQYEQLGNQLITRERIRIKSQQEPVRPSLLYWIKYYRDELGIGHHDSVQRGNFLFRSENGKRLSAEERERVNLVLKSVEENFPLEINTERSEIVFPVFETPAAPSPVPRPAPMAAPSGMAEKMRPVSNPAFSFGQSNLSAAPAPVAQGGEMSFSSKHVFPAEKSAAPQTVPAPQSSSANTPAAGQTVPRSNPFRIRPVSLGKEE